MDQKEFQQIKPEEAASDVKVELSEDLVKHDVSAAYDHEHDEEINKVQELYRTHPELNTASSAENVNQMSPGNPENSNIVTFPDMQQQPVEAAPTPAQPGIIDAVKKNIHYTFDPIIGAFGNFLRSIFIKRQFGNPSPDKYTGRGNTGDFMKEKIDSQPADPSTPTIVENTVNQNLEAPTNINEYRENQQEEGQQHVA